MASFEKIINANDLAKLGQAYAAGQKPGIIFEKVRDPASNSLALDVLNGRYDEKFNDAIYYTHASGEY